MNTEEKFNRAYFEGAGYSQLYRDFPSHYSSAEKILDRKPESVLEIGCGRGYVCRILQSHGVKAVGMDVSKHTWHTRAVNEFVLHDATVIPWQFKDKEFDMCFSIAFFEHAPENKLEPMIKEMARVSKRGLHGITFTISEKDTDPTHETIHPKIWWQDLFKKVAPDYPVEIVDKETLEPLPPNLEKMAPADRLVKLNIGCFCDMFNYGWRNLDIEDLAAWSQQRRYIFERVDVKNGIPYQNDSVDIILASHMIEHLTREEGKKLLAECLRVLKPDGLIRLVIPDSKLLAEKYLKGEIGDYKHVNIGVENASDDTEAFYHLLLAGHQTIYDYDSLKKVLDNVGFQNIKRMEPFKSQSEAIQKQTITMYCTLSCYLEGKKTKVVSEKTISMQDYLEGKIAEGKLSCQ